MRLRRMHIKHKWLRDHDRRPEDVFTKPNFDRMAAIYDPMPIGAMTMPFWMPPSDCAFTIEFTYVEDLTGSVPLVEGIPEVRVAVKGRGYRLH